MKVGIFFPVGNDEHVKMLSAFSFGLQSLNVDYELYPVDEYHACEIAVVFGIGKKNVPVSWPRGKIIDEQHKRGKQVIVIEKGFVNRDDYYMVGFNGLNNRANFRVNHQPSDRWEQLGVTLKPFHDRRKNIVICGQVPTDASVQNVDIIEWSVDTVKQAKRISTRPIVFRPHPLAIDRTPAIIGAATSVKPIEKELEDAFVVVTYNSNTAVEAIIEGVPAVACDEGSMAWTVAGHDIRSINSPLVPVESFRQQWANNLAYTQWNINEFHEGLPWQHLMRSGA